MASKTLSGMYKFKPVRYTYVHIFVYRYMCAMIVAHATYTKCKRSYVATAIVGAISKT